ncbi:Exportin-T [Diplonema papillatum]|nr:Exportin-T [Diplonema papillatum]
MAEDHLSMQGFMANSMTPPLSQRINSVNSFDSSGQHTPHPSPGCGQSPGDMNGHHDAFSDFSRAVRFALDPGIINNNPMGVQSALLMRQQAEAYLTGLKSNPRIWDFCTSIFQKPREHFEATEVFWGCSVLIELVTQRGDYFALPESGKAMFEATLLTWAKVNCSHLDLTKFQFVQNKFAQLLVIVFQHSGYPTRWTTFFEEIFALLPQGMQLIDLWLRILKAIDTHIVEHLQESTDPNVRARDTLIKDSMRATCMQQVTNTWYHILSQYHQTCPDISRQCMQVMAPYFAWIDIQMVTSEQWINMLYHFVSQPDLRDDAVVCLAELCGKKIADTRSKLQLLKSLRVADAMPELVASILNRHRNELTIGDESFDDGTGFLSNVTDLCLAVGVELMDLISSMLNRESAACKDEVDDAIKMLHTCLPMLFELLACGHSGISLKVCEHGVRRYVELLKKHPVTRAHLPSLLTIVAGRMAYFPDFFDFEETGDYEMTVNSLRKQLLIVFRNIATLEKDLALNFVVERVRAAVAACANTTVHWPQVEATLRILHCFGEELGATRATVFKQQDSVLSKVISEVFHCNISSAGTHQVSILLSPPLVRDWRSYVNSLYSSQPGFSCNNYETV